MSPLGEKRQRLESVIKSARIKLEYGSRQGPPMLVSDIILDDRNRKRTSLFTQTSKMAAASFSLPAGAPGEVLGTCPAAAEGVPRESGATYICDGCYAKSNNYTRYSSTQISQLVRLDWVRKQLADETMESLAKKPSKFATHMADAITRYHAKPRYVRNENKTRVYQDPKFFRIHDSGDFFSPEYMIAWKQVAALLEPTGMRFWAPTRMWIFAWPTFAKAYGVRIKKSLRWHVAFTSPTPANMTIRPSALYYGDPPPIIPGLAAGSSASLEKPPSPGNFIVAGQMVDKRCGKVHGLDLCRCPAYESDEANCASALCRTCWDEPMRTVYYGRH